MLKDTNLVVTEVMVKACEEWIKKFAKPIKNFKLGYSSYGLKHQVESYLRSEGIPLYILHMAFTQAAINLGYRHRQIPGSGHYEFNMSVDRWEKVRRA